MPVGGCGVIDRALEIEGLDDALRAKIKFLSQGSRQIAFRLGSVPNVSTAKLTGSATPMA